MNAPDAFEQTSVMAAREFLQTVVVVDNCAGFGHEDAKPADLVAPDDFATGPTVAAPHPATTGSAEAPLDATALSKAFACRKLVCAILKPSVEDRMEEAVRHASHRADVLVLDWQMDDDGELAASIIDGVLQDDGAEGRLRLIAVYTSRSPLSGVADNLAARVPRLIQNGLTFQAGSTRVVMLSKGGGANAPEEGGEAVEEADLPDRLLREFASLAQGLLSNATMAVIGGIRDHTHRMLARFGPRMDGPLLTHRALLQSAADADEFAADLIMAELQAQVPIRRIVSRFLDPPRIREYMDHRAAGGLKPHLVLNKAANPTTFELDAEQASLFVEKGLDALDAVMPAMAAKLGGKSDADAVAKLRKGMKDALHERLYLLFSGDLADGRLAVALASGMLVAFDEGAGGAGSFRFDDWSYEHSYDWSHGCRWPGVGPAPMVAGINLVHDEDMLHGNILVDAKRLMEELAAAGAVPAVPHADYALREHAELSFTDSASTPGIQAADVIAGFVMRFVRDFLAGKPPSRGRIDAMARIGRLSDVPQARGVNYVMSKHHLAEMEVPWA